MTWRLVGLILLLGVLPATWNACSKFGTNPSSSSTMSQAFNLSGTPGAAAFQSGLYAFVNSRGCVQCHASVVHPNFASPDFATAYAAAKGSQIGSNNPLIDFNDPDSSIFIDYAGNSHCNALPCSDPAVRPQVKAMLEQWATAEGGGVPTGPKMHLTETIKIPDGLPVLTAGSPVVMRFDLSKLSPSVPALSGAVFEVSIQMANATEYRLTDPRLGGNSQTVNVKGIHLFVRPSSGTGIGNEDTAQGSVWTSVNMSVDASTVPASGPLTTTPLSNTTLYIQSASSSDVLTIGFDSF